MLQLQLLQVQVGKSWSIFPLTDEALEDTTHQEAIQYVAGRKNMDRYRSVIDFLFCELFIQWQYACFKFYDETGPQLNEILSEEEIAHYDLKLVAALKMATVKHSPNWTKYRCFVLAELPHLFVDNLEETQWTMEQKERLGFGDSLEAP